MENQSKPQIEEVLIGNKKEKELVRPFRKYQLIIIGLLILMSILGFYLYRLNQTLNFHLQQHSNLYEQLYKEDKKAADLDDIYNRVEVNYKCLYELDKVLNIDIIRDLNELDIINGWIAQEKEIQYSVCYKATTHGDTALKFRSDCTHISPLLVLIETVDGFRFGGYTNEAFTDEGGFKNDPDAFLFSFDTKKKYKVIKQEHAIKDLKLQFPHFGSSDIVIHDGFFTNSNSYTEYPRTYEQDPNGLGDYILTGGIKHFKIKEMEILSVHINFDS